MNKRQNTITFTLILLLVTIILVTLTNGAIKVSLNEVFTTMLGNGNELQNFVILQLRLPRLVTALLAGAAFALAGSIFQITLRNTLASPDIMGITSGASAAAVFATLILQTNETGTIIAAFLGGITVAAIIFSLSWKYGLSNYRFILTGVACAFTANGTINYLISRANIQEANSAFIWLVGNISSPSWQKVFLLAPVVTLTIIATKFLQKPLHIITLGEKTAKTLGVNTTKITIFSLTIGIVLATTATAFTGPIAFVALITAPIVRKLTQKPEVNLMCTILFGAIFVATADLLAQNLPNNLQLPVGLVTGLVGGPYLLWLIISNKNKAGTL